MEMFGINFSLRGSKLCQGDYQLEELLQLPERAVGGTPMEGNARMFSFELEYKIIGFSAT